MQTTIDKPTLRESLSIAGNSSDLSVNPERRGDADVLIASGLAVHQIGRYLDQLTSEWDACTPPRRLNKQDIERVAQEMPRIKVNKDGCEVMVLDMPGAHEKAQKWVNAGRRRVLGKLKTLPKLMDESRGVMPWMVARGIAEPEHVLLDVLGWILDRKCPACNGTQWEVVSGTNRHGSKACRTCRGIGERDIPHGQTGRSVLEHLTRASEKSRNNAREVLRNMRTLKHFVASKEVQAVA